MSTLTDITSQYKAHLDSLNERIFKQLDSNNTLMSQIVLSLLRTKGKQLRPLMVIMCAKMFGPVDDNVLAAAASIELLHNASLIHDDVVDNSMTRRNEPTINAVWDNHIAVLVGDFYTSSSMQQAITTGDIRIIEAISRLGRNLTLGELDQIYNARQHSLTEDTYYQIIDYKTASLFICSASLGCFAAGASDKEREILENYARLFGRCFQIRDDVFDYFPSEQVGKPTGNDLREGKVSLPLLYIIENQESEHRQEVLDLLAKDELTDAEIAHIQAIARDNGGIDYAFDVMHRLRDQACSDLDQLPPTPQREQLKELFDFIIDRNF